MLDLIELGLSQDEVQLLKMPLSELSPEERDGVIQINDRRFELIAERNKTFIPTIRSINIISDDLGIRGVRNHADGKMYDSKSEYYKTTRAHGCEIVGNQPLPGKREQRGDYDCRKELATAIEQTGFMEKRKRK